MDKTIEQLLKQLIEKFDKLDQRINKVIRQNDYIINSPEMSKKLNNYF